ncbi:PulJ/GspJ family protein [Candidatus Uabimicrobium amorphum]|uniref:Prepilin-type N-terminal cleavage/methylation domain-containing protein n=1 Tax=Uabimicrobium amorphum TaxID=2596890 RepID=A0A5S9F3V9_UABAM|nr:type II secretion system protein [Candidatus Uabimicrobium amorphum]BBM83949.1 hypothetical protein UABAM_02304 [Candidatus Uabimicrobium amorphum]
MMMKKRHSGVTLLEIVIAAAIFSFMMGVVLSLTLNIQDATKTELDRSHLQSVMQGTVDSIVSDIRESKWRWTYVCNASNGAPAPNTFFLYPTGRDFNGFFRFGNTANGGLTQWQGMTLIAAIPDAGANINNSGEIRYNLWKFTDYRFRLDNNQLPLVDDQIAAGDDSITETQHSNVFIQENDTQIFVLDNLNNVLVTFNKDGSPTGGQNNANFFSKIIMKNVTRFWINAVVDNNGVLQLPGDADNEEKYRFPFSLDMEALYVTTGVRVQLSTAVLAENKNNL